MKKSEDGKPAENKKYHNYCVEVRFYGEHVDIAEIDAFLGISATNHHGFSARPRPKKFWGYDARGKAGYTNEWNSLEEGIAFVLEDLYKIKEKIILMTERYDAIWWCGHFQSGFDGGPRLSVEILSGIVELKIPIFIDNYFFESEDGD